MITTERIWLFFCIALPLFLLIICVIGFLVTSALQIPKTKILISKSSLREYLENRDDEYVQNNNNIIDYKFCEDTLCNIITVKNENEKIVDSLWGSPIMIYKEENNISPYRGNNEILKRFIRKTKPGFMSTLIFDIALKLDSIGRVEVKFNNGKAVFIEKHDWRTSKL